MLRGARLLDEAHAAMHLHTGVRDLLRSFGAPTLDDRNHELGERLVALARFRIRMRVRVVERAGGDVGQRAHRLGLRAHRQQHAPHVRVLDNGRGADALFLAHGAALHSLLRVRRRSLVSALGDAHAFEPDRETGQIHHDEHALEAAVFLADEVADRAAVVAVREHRGRARVNAELVLDRHALHVVARPERSVGVDQELRHDKERNPLHTLRRGRRARQHQVDDVVGVVVLAVGDEDLLAV